jgi:hypothetical protein
MPCRDHHHVPPLTTHLVTLRCIYFTADLQPEFWPTGLGGYNVTTGQWQAGFQAYAQHFHQVAQALNPCGVTPGGQKLLSGPGWGEQAAG